jgi:hypothetical protein
MLTNDEVSKDIRERTKVAIDTIKYFKELVNRSEDIQGIVRSPDLISARLSRLNFYLGSAVDKLNQSQELLMAQTEKEVKQVLDQINGWIDDDWANTKEIIEKAQLSPFKEEEQEKE